MTINRTHQVGVITYRLISIGLTHQGQDASILKKMRPVEYATRRTRRGREPRQQ